ncbi:ras-related protein Rab-36 isoform X2 [Tamandua tetradactyla]|uniref:ras-related protein Rab-36 isoform X2 n=1 Tax=Tamandua tetradactyla TaxID=48850 RepID=UPI0040543B96
MRSALPPLGPPVSRDRVIASFPKWYTSDACLQLKEHFHGQVSAACQLRSTGTVGCECELFSLRPQLVSLLHPSCPAFPAVSGSNSPRWSSSGTSTWGRPALSTGFVRTFLIVTTKPPSGWTLKSSASKSPESPTASRFIIMTFDLCDMQTLEHTRQWLQDALRENEPGSSFLFLVGTKKDLLPGAACEQVEAEAVRLAGEMQAEYWGECDGVLQPRGRPCVRAVGAAGAGKEGQRPATARRWSPHPNGGVPLREPGEQEAVQPGLLLAGSTP